MIRNAASFTRQYVITGYSLQTWYMPALLFGKLTVSILFKTIKNNKVFVCAFIVCAIILLWGTSYYYFLPQNKMIGVLLNTGLISLIRSVPFVFIGMYIASKVNSDSLRPHTRDFLWWTILGVGLRICHRYSYL